MSRTVAHLALCLASFSCTSIFGAEPHDWIDKNLPSVIELYKHFHQNPELSFHEEQTAARVAKELKAVGCEVTSGVGGTGVVGLLKNGEGPNVMWRTDLDALPVVEQTNLGYASKAMTKNDGGVDVGVMHACGHDIHITTLVALARYLAAHKSEWKGTVMFIGQPAEERGAGAKAMLKDGLFEKFPKPDYALALHVDSYLASGMVGYRAGYAMANVDSVDITCRGIGGHGSAPQTTKDPVVQAAYLIVDLQTIVSREISALEPAVVTVGSIHGGTKHNIIGNSCHLQITVRSYTDKVRNHILSAIKRKALATAVSMGAPEPVIEISEKEFTPALKNDEKLVARVVTEFESLLGKDNVKQAEPTMGGEDFARYGIAGVPIFMYRLGSVNADRLASYKKAGRPAPSLHSPIYYPDPEPTLRTGIATAVIGIRELMPTK